MSEVFKTPMQMLNIGKGAQILWNLFRKLPPSLPEGIRGIDIEEITESYLKKHRCVSALKGYRDFPAAICVSCNEDLVHGIPSDIPMRSGDVVTIDVAIKHEEWYSDVAWTFSIGKETEEITRLCKIAWEVSVAGARACKVGNTLQDISDAVANCAEKHKVVVYDTFAGHGVGFALHERPEIGWKKGGDAHAKLYPGMVLCIEPIIGFGNGKICPIEGNAVGYKSADRSISAHFEFMVAIYYHDSVMLSLGGVSVNEVPSLAVINEMKRRHMLQRNP